MYGIELASCRWDDLSTRPRSLLSMPRRLPRLFTPRHPRISLRNHCNHIVTYPRLRNGIYFADFKRDTRLHPEIYHCVIQQDGSPTILCWRQHPSLQDAISVAEAELLRLAASGAAGAAA